MTKAPGEDEFIQMMQSYGYKKIVDEDSGRIRKLCFQKGSFAIDISSDIMDNASVCIVFGEEVSKKYPENTLKFSEMVTKIGRDGKEFEKKLGGWDNGGLWPTDFGYVFRKIIETLPEIETNLRTEPNSGDQI
jgi:hypothetical protein